LYGDLLAESHAVITGIPGNGNAKILMGGLLSVGKRPDLQKHPNAEDHRQVVEFIEDVGRVNAYEVASLHPYAFKGDGKGSKAERRNPSAPTDSKDVKKVTERVKGNIVIARAALDDLGKSGEEKPIWITEIGWPVKGGGAENDGSHLLVTQDIQRDLLNSTFEMMKGESPLSPKQDPDIEHISYYNAEDWVAGLPVELDPHSWDSHCGLIEDNEGPKHGNKRKAWFAFQQQAE